MAAIKLTAIKPPKLPTGEEYAKVMQDATYKSAALMMRDLQATVQTWTKKPKFDITITQQGGNYSVTAATDDEIYGYVNDGTKPHEIKPKRSKYLRFSSGYKAKTRVGIIGSNDGGAFGDDVFSKGVHHPGFPAREFTKKIAQRRQVTVRQLISDGIAKVARKQS